MIRRIWRKLRQQDRVEELEQLVTDLTVELWKRIHGKEES